MMSMNLSIIAILSINAVNSLQKADLKKKKRIIKQKDLFSNIKLDKEILTLGHIEIEKNKSYRYESPIFKRYRY